MTDAAPAPAAPSSVLAHVQGKSPAAFCALFTLIAATNTWVTPHIELAAKALVIGPLAVALVATQIRPALAQACHALGAAALVMLLVRDWSFMANHGFLITYFACFFAATRTDDPKFWHHGVFFSTSMMAILMGFALIQKLTSPYFMSGNLIASLLLSGEAYMTVLSLLDERALEAVQGSREVIAGLGADHARQSAGASADLPPLPSLMVFAIYALTAGALFFQGLLEVAVIWHRRFGIWLHRLIFVFSLVVYTMRPENVFLSLNLMMGYALTDARSAGLRLPYAAAIVYLLGSALLGFRPDILR